MSFGTFHRVWRQGVALAVAAATVVALVAVFARADEPAQKPQLASGQPVATMPSATAPAATRPAMADLEAKLLELVNAERVKLKLPAFTADAALADVARAHSTDMLTHNFFNHDSPTTGNVGDRLFAAKVRVMGCSENIAKNVSLAVAHTDLMNSTEHKANILHKSFTRIGIGIVRGPDTMLYITQVFSVPAPVYDLATLPDKLATQLNQRRAAAGHEPIKLDPALSKIAAEQAALLARTGKTVAFDPSAKAKAAGLTFTKLGSIQGKTWNAAAIIAPDEFTRLTSGEIGLGFAEDTTHKDNGYGILWAVAVFASN